MQDKKTRQILNTKKRNNIKAKFTIKDKNRTRRTQR